MSKIFNTEYVDHMDQPMFFGKPVSVARYDRVKYPWLDKMTDKMNGFHWLPTVRDLTKDGPDFRTLDKAGKHIFLANLKRQILLDSIQGRAITKAFMPVASVPELEPLLVTWEYFETIHSRTYTHVIRTALPDASYIFDDIMHDEEIIATAKNLTKYYDEYIEYLEQWSVVANGFDYPLHEEIDFMGKKLTLYELKKKFFLCLFSVNVLEGLRFYTSFTCSWAFAEKNKMEGNAGLIKLIARDENIHTGITTKMIKSIVKEEPVFTQIFDECKDELVKMYTDTVQEEKDWAKYLFKYGSMIGLNAELLGQYIEYLASKRMVAVGLKSVYSVKNNPLKWVEKWTGSGKVQVANQETESTSYIIGGVESDLSSDNNALTDFEL